MAPTSILLRSWARMAAFAFLVPNVSPSAVRACWYTAVVDEVAVWSDLSALTVRWSTWGDLADGRSDIVPVRLLCKATIYLCTFVGINSRRTRRRRTDSLILPLFCSPPHQSQTRPGLFLQLRTCGRNGLRRLTLTSFLNRYRMELAGRAGLQGRRLASYECRTRTAGWCRPRAGPGLWLAEDTVITGCSWSLFRFFEADFEADMAERVKIISHLCLIIYLDTEL